MSENTQTEAPKKKMSLQDAIKQQLENKKKAANGNKANVKGDQSTKKMQSQQTKKASNTRRKMGV